MTPSFKTSREKGVDNSFSRFRIGPIAREAKDIGIIMLAGEPGDLFFPNQSGASTGDFVGRDAHPNAGSANQNPKIVLTLRHTARDRLRIVRVIGGLFGISPKVRNRNALLLQIMAKQFL